MAAVCNLYPLELEASLVPNQECLADEPNESDPHENENAEEWSEEIENNGPFLIDDIDIKEDVDVSKLNAQDYKDDSNRNSVVQFAPYMENKSGFSLRPQRKAAEKCKIKMKLINEMETQATD